MSVFAILLVVVLLVVLLGNPHLGPRVYQNYDYGYFPSGIGLVIAIVLVFLLLGGHFR